MKTATLKQGKRLLEMIEKMPAKQLQDLFEKGYINCLFNADVAQINHHDLCRICSYIPESFIWGTTRLNKHFKNADHLLAALKGRRVRVEREVKNIITGHSFGQSLSQINPEQDFDLVLITTNQLTGKGSGTTFEVFEGAKRCGLEKCNMALGPKIRLDCCEKPDIEEGMFVGMDTVTDSTGKKVIFSLEWDSLSIENDNPAYKWAPDSRWLFVRPRK